MILVPETLRSDVASDIVFWSHPGGVGSVDQSSDTMVAGLQPTPVALAIYRDLRLGVVVILVMLSAAIIVDRISATDWRPTLSEYFYTSAHSIFIAALLGLATLAFVYRGSSDTEDALLTMAGVAAMVAALVPQDRPVPPKDLGLRVDYPVQPFIGPNVWAVVIALVLGWTITVLQQRRHRGQQKRSPGGTLTLYVLRLLVIAALITLLFAPHWIDSKAHGAAGVVMIVSFIATVACAAYVVGHEEESPRQRRYRGFYRTISLVMMGTFIAVVAVHVIHPNWLQYDHWVIVLETTLILEFAVYWVVQTVELWNTVDRRERLPERARSGLPEVQSKGGLAGLKSDLAEAMKQPAGQRLLPLL